MVIVERAAIVLASLALSVGLIAVLSGFFASHDPAGVAGRANGPGQQFVDQGHAHLSLGQPHPSYDSDPPTSGPHVPELAQRDDVALSNDELLEALELGNVVLMYGSPSQLHALQAVTHGIAAPFSPALVASGQAVILAPRAGTRGVIALAWAHMLGVKVPYDPALVQFVQYWLGRGAPGR